MEWKQLEADWQQASPMIITQWPSLTAEDLSLVAGNKDQLVAKLHQRHGYTVADGAKQLDAWMSRTPFEPRPPEAVAEPVEAALHADAASDA